MPGEEKVELDETVLGENDIDSFIPDVSDLIDEFQEYDNNDWD